MKFEYINLDEWKRGKLFRKYIDDMRIVMCLTADIDVTNVRFHKTKQFEILPHRDVAG